MAPVSKSRRYEVPNRGFDDPHDVQLDAAREGLEWFLEEGIV